MSNISNIQKILKALPSQGIQTIFSLLSAPQQKIQQLTGKKLHVAFYYATFVVLALTTTANFKYLKFIIETKFNEDTSEENTWGENILTQN